MRSPASISGMGLAAGRVLHAVNVVKALQLGGLSQIDLHDDLLCQRRVGLGAAHGGGRHQPAVLRDGAHLDQRHVDGAVLAVTDVLGHGAQMGVLVERTAIVDRLSEVVAGDVRRPPGNDAGVPQQGVELLAGRRAGEQTDPHLPALLTHLAGQRLRHGLGTARGCEAADGHRHAVPDQAGGILRRRRRGPARAGSGSDRSSISRLRSGDAPGGTAPCGTPAGRPGPLRRPGRACSPPPYPWGCGGAPPPAGPRRKRAPAQSLMAPTATMLAVMDPAHCLPGGAQDRQGEHLAGLRAPRGMVRLSSSQHQGPGRQIRRRTCSAELWVRANRKLGRITLENQIWLWLRMVSARLMPPRASGP
jgi:hypothetical protein